MGDCLTISDIVLESTGELPWKLKQRGWICYTFYVKGPENVTRKDLSAMVGHEFKGKPIRGVESFLIENQLNKPISIAIDE